MDQNLWDDLELQVDQKIYNETFSEALAQGKSKEEAEKIADARLLAISQINWDEEDNEEETVTV